MAALLFLSPSLFGTERIQTVHRARTDTAEAGPWVVARFHFSL